MTNIHLIGIGGAGLSAIATVLLQQGYHISGSDIQASSATARLIELGASVFIGHQAGNLADDLDVVVVSSAIAPDNPELVEAQRRGLTVAKRADWLGQMMQHQTGIAIAGTHGKTTTTAMTAFVLQEAGQDPTYIVGGFIPQMNTNAAAGQGPAFVIEADEYDHMFLGLRPKVAVITIVEWDHPDIFPTFDDLHSAFTDFVQLVPDDGLIIGCGDAPGVGDVVRNTKARVVTYGLQAENDWRIVDLQPNRRGGHDFKINTPSSGDQSTTEVSLAVPGLHNVYNAVAALIAAHQQGLDLGQAADI
ncbi:MAG: UDP-N-acetylmuramate--L-alanine ligase, partial [Chloroflexi bacterium]|nr:UDP-N-acetylmuramate--L-alanine ligase [Chloroflexota bacterium]